MAEIAVHPLHEGLEIKLRTYIKVSKKMITNNPVCAANQNITLWTLALDLQPIAVGSSQNTDRQMGVTEESR